MAGAAAGDDGDLRISGVGAEVDDSVFRVESAIGVRFGYAGEGGEDEMGGIVDEVFGGHDCYRLLWN